MLKAGHNLLLNKRRWQIRAVRPVVERVFDLEAIGASEASLGMTRQLRAVLYGDDLFIEQHHQRCWHGHLQHDWIENEYDAVLQCKPATWLDVLNAHTRHPAVGRLKNDFSWSYSRAAKYQHCPRAYYYHYYAAWEGWQENAPAPVRRAYLLKNLTDVPRWVGTLVHETLKFALARLKAGQPVPEIDLIKQMHVRAKAVFANSQSGRYQRYPSQLIGFQEHYYQTGLAETTWPAAWAQAKRCVRAFLNSSLYAHLRQQPAIAFLDIKTLQSFTVAGEKVWVQMDLARRDGHSMYIYDWKSGSAADEPALRQQLAVYGLYFQQTWPEIAAGEVTVRGIVYALDEDRLIEFELSPVTLQEIQAKIENSIGQLKGLLLDPGLNLAELQNFPMIEDRRVCRHCQFRELCGRA